MEWWQVLFSFVGSGLGVTVPFGIWWFSKQREDEDRKQRLFELLMVELAANQQIIEQGIASVERVLRTKQPNGSAGSSGADPIEEEGEIQIAPLFFSSFESLVNNDLLRHFPADVIPDLYEHYAKVSRANWLISRVQHFRFRGPILRAICDALKEAKQTQAKIRNRLDIEKTKRLGA